MSEKWLKEHDNLEKLLQKANQSLSERAKYPKSSSNYNKITNQLKTQLGKIEISINGLERALEDSNESKLTYLEKNRRANMLNQLKTSLRQIDQGLKGEGPSQKDSLLIDFEAFNAQPTESEETVNFNSEQLSSQHDRIIQNQERGLETLSHVIQNQKRIATTIGGEVDRQNDLIDSMGDKMDNLNERLIKETRNTRVIMHKSGTCGLWMIVLILLIAIIIIAAIPI
ncbi:syntaxin-8 [Brachionus plicatilis]|uniref:Syntaxin-8 n=1 Tax=Brachionus plicatilis TaxID=10195 RepID=A0A3M7PQJ0_BRAPC|nr:syntaxin-8 [Brachionus plicatilis]